MIPSALCRAVSPRRPPLFTPLIRSRTTTHDHPVQSNPIVTVQVHPDLPRHTKHTARQAGTDGTDGRGSLSITSRQNQKSIRQSETARRQHTRSHSPSRNCSGSRRPTTDRRRRQAKAYRHQPQASAGDRACLPIGARHTCRETPRTPAISRGHLDQGTDRQRDVDTTSHGDITSPRPEQTGDPTRYLHRPSTSASRLWIPAWSLSNLSASITSG